MDMKALTREQYLELADDERPHLYPGREASNSCYVGTKNQPGCRCTKCRAEHAEATRKNRRVIQLEPESVSDQLIGPEPIQGEPQPVVEAHSAPSDPPGNPQHAQAVYDDLSGPLTAEDVARLILKEAVKRVKPSGELPQWMLMAREIARDYRVPVEVAQAATRINKPYIAVRPTFNGGVVALIKRPV